MLQNAMLVAFTVSELFKENQQGGNYPTPTQIRVKTKNNRKIPC